MWRKNIIVLTSLMIAGLYLPQNQAMATDVCEKHLKTTCNSCHSNKEPCSQLGNSLKDWEEILSRMILNGAALSKKEVAAMAECLSQPSAAAKAACQK
ncbi:MAG: hypothetical protein A2505_03140 [Deltaproteobacteria bacterium RIFOXYD12_FULL_55_16]|nr:MAG: hypothetical protein A2505_03140 [Deltaproteobacteria bacterium RIFOXYD12_FULL_55_16]